MFQWLKKKIRSRKQYYQWLASYLVITVLTLLVNVFAYAVAQNVLQGENERTNEAMTENIKEIYDNNFKDAQAMAQRILLSNSVQLFETASEMSPERRNDRIREIINNISSYVGSSNFVENCVVVLKEKDLCFDALGMYNCDLAYHIFFQPYYDSMGEWEKSVFEGPLAQFVVLTDKEGARSLFFIQKSPTLGKQSATAIVVQFSTGKIENFLKNSSKNGSGQVYITEEEGTVLFGGQAGPFHQIQTGESSGKFEMDSDGDYRMIHYIHSDVAQVTYLYTVSRKIYQRTVNLVKFCFVLCFFFCAGLGGVLAWLFTKANYRPLGSLINQLGGGGERLMEPEYKFIQRSIETLEKNKKEVEKQVKEQSSFLRENLLSQILLRRVRVDGDNLNFLKNNGIQLEGKYFLVVAFDIVSAGVLEKDGEEEDFSLACFVISNVFTELLGGEVFSNYCRIDRRHVCALSFENRSQQTWIMDRIEYTRVYLQENLGVCFVCAISQMTDDIAGLADIYEQTLEIIDFRLLQEDKWLFVYDDVMHSSIQYEFSLETQRQLVNMLLMGQEKDAVALIEHVYERNRKKHHINLSMLRLLTVELTGTLLKAAAEIDKEQELDTRTLLMLTSHLSGEKSLREIKLELFSFVEQLCRLSKAVEKPLQNGRMDEIKRYIQQNYQNPDLNVSMIADTFHMSLYYISRSFKQDTGEGMAEYIIGLRMEKAKEKLRTQSGPIAQVAQDCGFSSVNSFNRTFKKMVGMAPKQFREYSAKKDG